jgi:hypothetical protein
MGHWETNPWSGEDEWVDDPPPQEPINWNDPYWGQNAQGEGNAFKRWQYEQAGVGAGGTAPYSAPEGMQYNQWPGGYGGALSSNINSFPNKTTAGGATGGNPTPGGGGGGGGGGGTPDPYAWMADFGGPAIFKAFLRNPGEKVTDYYNRHGGDPLKTILAKYQEIKGMAPTTELRQMMVGALGWGGVIDPNTLEPVSVAPNSAILDNLAKTGGNYNSYNKGSGLRMVGTRPWTEVAGGFANYAAPGAAIWPPT